MRIIPIVFLVIFLLLMIFTTILFGSIFFDLKKAVGNFVAYYSLFMPLLGVFITTRGLIKAIKRKYDIDP